jgi:hypothetical protein
VQHEALCLVHLVQTHPAPLIGANLVTMTTMAMMMAVMKEGLLAKMVMAVLAKMMAVLVKTMAVLVKMLPCYLHFVRRPWLTICLHRLSLQQHVQVH